MNGEPQPGGLQKPLAGGCAHSWQDQKSRYLVAQLCKLCKLYRYKASPTADWEYRAPIAFPQLPPHGPSP